MRLTGAQIWIYGNGRYFSSGKRKKAKAKILSLNYELKELYGAVVRKENTNDTHEDEPFNKSKWEHAQKELQSPKASEVYWLADHKVTKKRIKVLKTGSKTTPTSPSSPPTVENSVETAPHKVEHTDSLVTSTEQLLLKFISSKSNRTPAIPFDAPGLNSIPQYPLVCQKASTEQIDEALKNKLPSISKILTATMPEGSRYILKKWKLAKIAELGEEGFREYEQKTFKTGQMFHTSIENYFEDRQLPDESSPVYALWQSVGGVLVELDPKPVLIEKSVVHPDLKYKGIIDSVAVIK